MISFSFRKQSWVWQNKSIKSWPFVVIFTPVLNVTLNRISYFPVHNLNPAHIQLFGRSALNLGNSKLFCYHNIIMFSTLQKRVACTYPFTSLNSLVLEESQSMSYLPSHTYTGLFCCYCFILNLVRRTHSCSIKLQILSRTETSAYCLLYS